MMGLLLGIACAGPRDKIPQAMPDVAPAGAPDRPVDTAAALFRIEVHPAVDSSIVGNRRRGGGLGLILEVSAADSARAARPLRLDSVRVSGRPRLGAHPLDKAEWHPRVLLPLPALPAHRRYRYLALGGPEWPESTSAAVVVQVVDSPRCGNCQVCATSVPKACRAGSLGRRGLAA